MDGKTFTTEAQRTQRFTESLGNWGIQKYLINEKN